jgi:hypothetical protein
MSDFDQESRRVFSRDLNGFYYRRGAGGRELSRELGFEAEAGMLVVEASIARPMTPSSLEVWEFFSISGLRGSCAESGRVEQAARLSKVSRLRAERSEGRDFMRDDFYGVARCRQGNSR